MKRPLLVVAIGYIIGIIWGLYCNCSIALMHTIIICIYILAKLSYSTKREFKLFSFKRYFRYIKLILKLNVIITIIISSIISDTIVKNLNNKYDNLYSKVQNNIEVVGTVVSNKKEKQYKDVYKIKIDTVNGKSRFKNTYLLLNVKKDTKQKIEYGDKLKIIGDFAEPSGQRNYKGFDYKKYLKTQKIYGTIKSTKIDAIDKNCANFVLMQSNKIFLKIKQNIEEIFPENHSQLLLGIMLGYTDELDENIIQEFRDSNISHILAVSGMHISFVILGLMIVFKNSLGKRNSNIVVIIVLTIYMCITGFSPSVVRATIMGNLMLAAGLFHRKNDIWTSIAISILIILIYNPFLLNSISVLLSYGGTIGIIVFSKQIISLLEKAKIKNKKYKYRLNPKITRLLAPLKEALAITISSQIVIIPIMAIYFNTFGIAFLLTNVAVSLIIGPIVILGFVCIVISFISISLFKILSYVLNPMLQILVMISTVGNKLPLNKFYIETPEILEILIYYIFIFGVNYLCILYFAKSFSAFHLRVKNIISLLKYKINKNKNKLLVIILICVVVLSVIKFIPKDLRIYFVDVGQGDCTLITTPAQKTILIDGGGSMSEDYDVGKNTLIPYLLDRKITKIDYVVISHFDQDHVGGILTVLQELQVGNVFISEQIENSKQYEEFKKIIKAKRIKVESLKLGDKLNIGKNLVLNVLYPTDNMIKENAINNNSLVMKLEYKNFAMLFTGDIEKIAEKDIVNNFENTNQLKSTVIKIPHHGSKTSSTEELLKMVSPQIAVIGVGKNNLYKHPSDEIIERLKSFNIDIYRTDKNGEVVITVNKKGKIKIDKMLK